MSGLLEQVVAITSQNRFFFLCWACFLAISSFLRLSSALLRSAFSSGVSSCTSSTRVGSSTTSCGIGGGDDLGVGECVSLKRVVDGDAVISRCEEAAS